MCDLAYGCLRDVRVVAVSRIVAAVRNDRRGRHADRVGADGLEATRSDDGSVLA